MKKTLLILCAALVPLLAIAGYAAAGGGQSTLDVVRRATAPYHDLQVAKNAGYTTELALFGTTTTCIWSTSPSARKSRITVAPPPIRTS